jgi:hypothetical protein
MVTTPSLSVKRGVDVDIRFADLHDSSSSAESWTMSKLPCVLRLNNVVSSSASAGAFRRRPGPIQSR